MSRIAAFWKPSLASTGIPGALGAPDAPGASPTPLVGHRLIAARLLWLGVVLLCDGLLVASLPQRYTALLHPTAPGVHTSLLHLGLSTAFYAAYHLTLEIIPALGFLAMALVIYVRRSDEWPAIFVSLVLVAFGAALPGTMYTLVADQPIWGAPYPVLEGLGWFLLLVFAYLFPDGRFAPRWIGWLTPVWAAWVVGFFALAPVLAPRGTWLVALTFVLWIGWFGTGVLAQTYRYLWTATPMQRQQTKWVVLGLVGALLGVALAAIPSIAALSARQAGQQGLLYQLAATAVMSLSALCIPLSLGIAILRHRLFDIDVLINRALVYGSLTVLLAAVYFAVVVGLQSLATALTRQTTPQPVIVVASTLLIAALFNPLRHRIQATIDRRFFRRKYDAARTLERLAAALRRESDLDALSGQVLVVVQETMQPTHISLWLAPPRQPREVALDMSPLTSASEWSLG